jgi:hypothetical protein
VESSESFDLDFDSVGTGKTKPSKAAIQVNELLEVTTGLSIPFIVETMGDLHLFR